MPLEHKQIMALEKAIEEKYGEIAVLPPQSLWNTEKEKAYLEQAKGVAKYYRQSPEEDYKDQGGFLLKEKLINKKNFTCCSYCKEQAYKSIDDVYMTKFGSCYKCYIINIEGKITNGRNQQ